jgi:Na+-transporting NADH:ubiquinone oxidoreductase subunit NqrB
MELRIDARIFQIVFLSVLLGVGVLVRDFSLWPEQIVLTFAAGILTQIFWIRRLGLKNVNLLSAVITCLGTCLLLRSDRYWVHPLAVSLAMSSKFILRVGDKHVFNPAAFGVILSLVCFPGTWISPGQWGFEIAATGWLLALGSLVVWRARSQIISWPFLLSYGGLLVYRVLRLGYSPWVWVHQMQNGAILLFAFFMISDPKTTPNHSGARIIHAALVAYLGYYWQFRLFHQNGLVWAIILLAPTVSILDALFKSKAFAWKQNVPPSVPLDVDLKPARVA